MRPGFCRSVASLSITETSSECFIHKLTREERKCTVPTGNETLKLRSIQVKKGKRRIAHNELCLCEEHFSSFKPTNSTDASSPSNNYCRNLRFRDFACFSATNPMARGAQQWARYVRSKGAQPHDASVQILLENFLFLGPLRKDGRVHGTTATHCLQVLCATSVKLVRSSVQISVSITCLTQRFQETELCMHFSLLQ